MKQDFGLEMVAVADQLYATVRRHEKEENDGKTCPVCRFYAIAVLCVKLGINPKLLTMKKLACFIEAAYEGTEGTERQHDDQEPYF